MATASTNKIVTPPSSGMINLPDLAVVLIRHFGYHEGHYELAFEFSVAIGAVGPSPNELLPGAMFGVRAIGLNRVEQPSPGSVDAAVANPVG
jgi:hypothetical protein